MIVLLALPVFGVLDDRVLHQYNFGAESSTTFFYDELETFNGSNSGTASKPARFPYYATSGDGSPSSLGLDDAGGFSAQNIDTTNFKSMCFWLNHTTPQAGFDAIFYWKDAQNNRVQIAEDGGDWVFRSYDAGVADCECKATGFFRW